MDDSRRTKFWLPRWPFARSPKAAALLLAAVLGAGAVFSYQTHVRDSVAMMGASEMLTNVQAGPLELAAMHGPAQGAVTTSVNAAASGTAFSPMATTPQTTSNRLVEQSATLNLMVSGVAATRETLTSLTTADGGFVSSSNQYGFGHHLHVQMQVRIPEAHFASFVHQSQQFGTVLNFSQSGQDVTQTYNDHAQQLSTLRSELAAYTRLFTKAKSMKDMLTIQQAIIEVQSQMANLTGQQQGLMRAVTFATVSIELTPPAFANTAPAPIVSAWNQVLTSLGQSGLGLLTLIAWAVPWAVLFAIVIIAYRFAASHRKRRS